MESKKVMSDIAVIILNYNSWEDTLKEVELLEDLFRAQPLDIIVVDNHSPNNSYEELHQRGEGRFTLLGSDENKGYASGNNIGLKFCRDKGYRYAWILNNDILIDDKEILTRLKDVLLRDETVAVVNPDIYALDGHMFNRDSVRPSFYDLTFGMFRYRKKGRIVRDLGGYGYVYRPQGCCMLVDLEKLEEVGYMDEHTFLYHEENILSERLLKKAYKCACRTDCRVIHNHSATVSSNIKKRKIVKIKIESFDYYLKAYRHYGAFKRHICRLFYKFKLKLLS